VPNSLRRNSLDSNSNAVLKIGSRAAELRATSLKINGKITLGLALRTGVVQRGRPALGGAVVLQLPVLHRSMRSLVNIVQSDCIAFILAYGKAQTICAAFGWHPGASAGVAQIAEIFEFDLRGRNGFRTGAARPTEAGAQRQTARERPANQKSLFFGKEKRTRHDSPILVLMPKIV
jgi:hypothetical protein